MDRELLQYHPEWLQEFKEIQILSGIQQSQAEKMYDDIESIWNNNYYDTLNEGGCERWESMLNLSSNGTLEERILRIKSAVAEQRPFTLKNLKNMLNQLVGEGNYIVVLEANEYRITVLLNAGNDAYESAVSSLLDRVCPANLIRVVQTWTYNPYMVLESLTHEDLSAYTYTEVREETDIT